MYDKPHLEVVTPEQYRTLREICGQYHLLKRAFLELDYKEGKDDPQAPSHLIQDTPKDAQRLRTNIPDWLIAPIGLVMSDRLAGYFTNPTQYDAFKKNAPVLLTSVSQEWTHDMTPMKNCVKKVLDFTEALLHALIADSNPKEWEEVYISRDEEFKKELDNRYEANKE